MKVPLSWLREFVEINVSPEELARRLSLSGMEVSGISYVGVEGAELPWDAEKIVVANILEVRPHPNADRLVLADVDYGAGQPHTVVTGAPNLFPYKNKGPLGRPLRSVFAREGARLYDGHAEGRVITTLKGRPVRGVMSDAMLCSEKELGISDEHEGIIFLEDDAPIGMPLRDLLGEVVLEIDITPNYARCLSIVGIAREVAAILNTTLHLPEVTVQMQGPPLADRAQVTIEDPQLCPRFVVGLIEGITIGPSPHWMQRRLRHAGMRPINNIVDISNYVMLEWGEPNHAFDADKVKDLHLIARVARPGEQLKTLDGKLHDLTPGQNPVLSHAPMLVCDPAGPLSIAGVMGGEQSEVSATTTRVLLEAAVWEPSQIRKTVQALKQPSEASYRFERGVDYALSPIAERRCLELMRTIAGGTVAEGLIDAYPAPWRELIIDLTPHEVARIVGVHLSARELADLLGRLGFRCKVIGEGGMGDFATSALNDLTIVQVTVPSFRQDITIPADLCEEVARIYGYERIPSTRMADELPVSDAHPDLELEQRARELMVGCGLDEVISYSLTSMEAVALVNPAEAQPERYLQLTNPSTPEREYMRRSLLPTLLELLAANLRERERVAIFEIGRVYLPLERPGYNGEWLPDEPRRLAIAMAGPRSELGWSGGGNEPLDFFDLKGVVETLVRRLNLESVVSYVPLTDDERFHPGRAAALLLSTNGGQWTVNGKEVRTSTGRADLLSTRVGVLGELHPAVRERLDLGPTRALVAELDLQALIEAAGSDAYRPISRFPAAIQDLAIVAPAERPAEDIATVIRRGAGALLESLILFDIYTGPQVGEGKRSLAYRLTFRANDRTLSDEALAQVRQKIVKLLERELGATIRG